MGRLVGSLDPLFGRGRAEGGYGDESLQSLHAEGESKLSGAGEKGAELFVLTLPRREMCVCLTSRSSDVSLWDLGMFRYGILLCLFVSI